MIRPPFLQQGDLGVIVAPAKKVEKAYIQNAIDTFENWGLKVDTGQHLFDGYYRYAGNDPSRLEDLQLALDNPNIKLIVAGRGGYGTNRIVDRLDWTAFLDHPKWVVGFSDLTILLGALHKRNVMSIHGIMPSFFLWENAEVSIEALQQLLFGNPSQIKAKPSSLNVKGKSHGQIIGGNLSILTSMIRTSSDYDYKGKILLIEEISEPLYKVDRMMVQLKRSGNLDELKGIVCGQFTNCNDDDEPFGKTAYEIVKEHTQHLNIPTAFNFPIGHTAVNYPVVIGGKYLLKVDDEGASIEPML